MGGSYLKGARGGAGREGPRVGGRKVGGKWEERGRKGKEGGGGGWGGGGDNMLIFL